MQDLNKYVNNKTTTHKLSETLRPYFENFHYINLGNSQILRIYGYLEKYSTEQQFAIGIKEVLLCYREIFRTKPKDVAEIIALTQRVAPEKENLMWTINKTVKSSSELHDEVYAIMRLIGDVLEISVKYIINEIFALLKLNNTSIDYKDLCKVNFGSAVQSILNAKKLEPILKTRPIKIKLSEWRNIAYHHTYEITDNNIVCTYGHDKTFTLSIDELKSYAFQISQISNIFNIARCIFVYDNSVKIAEAKNNLKIDSSVLRTSIRKYCDDIEQLPNEYYQ